MSWFKKARDPYQEYLDGEIVRPEATEEVEDTQVYYDVVHRAYRNADGLITEDLFGPGQWRHYDADV